MTYPQTLQNPEKFKHQLSHHGQQTNRLLHRLLNTEEFAFTGTQADASLMSTESFYQGVQHKDESTTDAFPLSQSHRCVTRITENLTLSRSAPGKLN